MLLWTKLCSEYNTAEMAKSLKGDIQHHRSSVIVLQSYHLLWLLLFSACYIYTLFVAINAYKLVFTCLFTVL